MSSTELAWFKSSYSGTDGDECVEVALSWRTSSHSQGGQAACADTVHVRDSKDSKDKYGPRLAISPAAWGAFTAYAAR